MDLSPRGWSYGDNCAIRSLGGETSFSRSLELNWCFVLGRFWDVKSKAKIHVIIKGSIVCFWSEQVLIKGFITLKPIFGLGENTWMIKVRYLVVKTLNLFEVIFSTLYLSMKYLLENGCISMLQGDQEFTRKCYRDRLRIRILAITSCVVPQWDTQVVSFVDLDPRVDCERERAFTQKLLWVRRLWKVVMKDSYKFVEKSNKCQKHYLLHHAST